MVFCIVSRLCVVVGVPMRFSEKMMLETFGAMVASYKKEWCWEPFTCKEALCMVLVLGATQRVSWCVCPLRCFLGRSGLGVVDLGMLFTVGPEGCGAE